jgi:D-3-phosphoglycerate dehydrogenase
MSFKVVMPMPVEGEASKYTGMLKQLGASFEGRECTTEDQIIALARQADAIITSGTICPIHREVIESLSQCRIIALIQVGYDDIDTEAAAERGILVTNVPGYCTEEVAEHTMALVLACSRKLVSACNAVKRGYWQHGSNCSLFTEKIRPGIDRVGGRTLGLFGFGQIAKAVVPKARGFGMRIIACGHFSDQSEATDMGVEPVDWKTLLRESDFISILASLNAETRRIFNRDAFRQMKPSACLINTARGAFVDEQALYEALTKGQLAMAALDTFDPEPPSLDNPLLSLENVISTGHTAYFSPASLKVKWRWPIEEISLLLRNEWPRAIVNPTAKEKFSFRWGAFK